MLYKVIGIMSGSSLDGLDIVYTELLENRGAWSFQILNSACYEYEREWKERLENATTLTALDYQLLHAHYGHYIGQQVNRFIDEHHLHYKVALIASHGHTAFHIPAQKMTAQLGDGAAIAAETGLPVVSDLRALDIAFGGQGAPIVPIGEKLLFGNYEWLLNIGGIANLSFHKAGTYYAFDICPANRVLNIIAQKLGKEYDENGTVAAAGVVHRELLEKLNALPYYSQSYPKSLANTFGVEEVYPLIQSYRLSPADELRTMTEHIVQQVKNAIVNSQRSIEDDPTSNQQLLITGGGAFNTFLIDRLKEELSSLDIDIVVPDETIVQYKEALIMALIGVLRWRQEYTVLSSVTGAERDSIGGAVWIGQEA